MNYKLLASGISEKIVNTESNRIGAFKFFDVFPQQSCTEGGKKIVMISEFPLNTDTEPQFQLWDQLGERVDEEIEKQILKQAKPTEVSKVQNTIIFISPPQPNYLQIVEQSYKVKLVAVRKAGKMTCRMAGKMTGSRSGSHAVTHAVGRAGKQTSRQASRQLEFSKKSQASC